MDVIVGLYKGSKSESKAISDGLQVFSVSEACEKADGWEHRKSPSVRPRGLVRHRRKMGCRAERVVVAAVERSGSPPASGRESRSKGASDSPRRF